MTTTVPRVSLLNLRFIKFEPPQEEVYELKLDEYTPGEVLANGGDAVRSKLLEVLPDDQAVLLHWKLLFYNPDFDIILKRQGRNILVWTEEGQRWQEYISAKDEHLTISDDGVPVICKYLPKES